MSSFNYLKNIKNIISETNVSDSIGILRMWHEQAYGTILYIDSNGTIALITIKYSNSDKAYVGVSNISINGSVNFSNRIDDSGNRYILFDVASWCKATAIYLSWYSN